MVSQPNPPRLTMAEFISMENASEVRHEYDHGHFWAMVGGSFQHTDIVANLTRYLGGALYPRCRVAPFEYKVQAVNEQAYFYPDLVIVCGERQVNGTVLLNPTVIVEVLSPSTEAYDRGRKFALYRRIASLQEYVIIEQSTALVEVYQRGETLWRGALYEGRGTVARLNSVALDVPLAEVYAQIELKDE
jgi:Uma2 family endonuclease